MRQNGHGLGKDDHRLEVERKKTTHAMTTATPSACDRVHEGRCLLAGPPAAPDPPRRRHDPRD
jgi:hypothetical protein